MENELELGPDILSVTDDNGKEILFELLERYEIDDKVYVAITEYFDEAEDIVNATGEVICLKVVSDDNGDEYLEEIDNEEEYNKVSDILMAMIEEEYDVIYDEDDNE